MDAVVLVSAGLAPPVEHDDGHLLPLGERGVVGERPLGRHRLQNRTAKDTKSGHMQQRNPGNQNRSALQIGGMEPFSFALIMRSGASNLNQ
jgi:hypothetical protein